MAVGSVKLPELKQDIKVDTKDLDRAVAAAKRFKTEMERALKPDAGGVDKEFADLENRINRMADANRRLRDSNDEVGKSFRRQAGEVDNFASTLSRAETEMRRFADTQDRAFKDNNLAKWAADGDKATAAMRNLTTETRNLLGAQDDLGNRLDATRGHIDDTSRSLNDAAGAAARLRQSLASSFDVDTSQWEASTARVKQTLQDLTSESRSLRSEQEHLGAAFRQTRQDAQGTAETLNEIAAAAARARAALAGSFNIDTSRWESQTRTVLARIRELSDATDELRGHQVELGASFRNTRDDAREAAAALTALAAAARAVSNAGGAFNIDTSSWMRQTAEVQQRLRDLMRDTDNLRASQERLGESFRRTRQDAKGTADTLDEIAAAAARARAALAGSFNIDTSRWRSEASEVLRIIRDLSNASDDLRRKQEDLGASFRKTRQDADEAARALAALAAAARSIDRDIGLNIDTSRWQAQIGQVRETLRGLREDTDHAADAAQRLGDHMRRMRGDADETRTALEALAAAAAAFSHNVSGAFNIDTSRWRSEVSEVRDILKNLNDDSEKLLATQQKLGAGFRELRGDLTNEASALQNVGEASRTVSGDTDNLSRSNKAAASAVRATTSAANEQQSALRRLEQAAAALEKAEHALAEAHLREEAESLRVFAAAEKVAVAHEKGAQATAALEEAEDRLARAQAAQVPNAQRIAELTDDVAQKRIALGQANAQAAEAEAKLNDAAIKHEAAIRRVTQATDDQSEATHRLRTAQDEHHSSLLRLNDDNDRAVGIMGRLGQALSTAVGGVDNFTAGLQELGSKVVSVGGNVAAMAGQFALFAGIAGGISFLVGGIAAAIGGLVPVVAAAVPIVATLAIGFQNFGDAVGNPTTPSAIKKQQEALAKLSPSARATAEAINHDLIPAFHGLQQAVQERLFQGMADEMRKIAGLAKPIQDGLVGIAGSLNDMARAFLDAITTAEGMRRVTAILDNAKQLVDGLRDPLLHLGDALSNVASRGELMRPMIGIFQDLINKTAEWFQKMADTGAFEAGLNRLRDLLGTLEDAFFDVLSSATNFFTQAEPGVQNLVGAIGNVASSLLDRLGPAFGTAADAAGDFLNRIPQSAWDSLARGAESVARGLEAIANSGAVEVLSDIAGTVTETLGTTFENAARGLGAIGDALNWIETSGSPAAQILQDVGIAIQDILNVLGFVLNPLGGLDLKFSDVGQSGQEAGAGARAAGQGADEAGRGAQGATPHVEGLGGAMQEVQRQARQARADLVDVAKDAGATGRQIQDYAHYLDALPDEVVTDIEADPARARQTYEDWKNGVANAPPIPARIGGDTRPLDHDADVARSRVRDHDPTPAGVSGDTDPFHQDVDTARSDVEGATPARVPLSANLDQFNNDLASRRGEVEGPNGAWHIPLVANFDQFQTELGDERTRVEAVAAAWSIPLKANLQQLQTDLGNERTRVENAGAAWSIPFRANLQQLQTDLGNERTRIEDAGAAWAVPFRANLDQLNQELQARLDQIANTPIVVRFTADVSQLESQVKAVIDRLQGTNVIIPVVGNFDQFINQYTDLANKVQSTIIYIPVAGDFTNFINQYNELVQKVQSTIIYIPVALQLVGGLGGLGGGGGGGGGGGIQYTAQGAVSEYFAQGGMSQRDRIAMKAMLGGGIQYNAGGGMNRQLARAMGLTPMSATQAQIVPPNTWRVVGDRPAGDEAFIPVNNSSRSQMLLEETARRMGYAIQKMAAGGFGNANTTTTPGPSNTGAYTHVKSETNTAAPLIGGDLIVTVPQDTPVQDSMDEVLFQLRRVQRGGVHVRTRTRGR